MNRFGFTISRPTGGFRSALFSPGDTVSAEAIVTLVVMTALFMFAVGTAFGDSHDEISIRDKYTAVLFEKRPGSISDRIDRAVFATPPAETPAAGERDGSTPQGGDPGVENLRLRSVTYERDPYGLTDGIAIAQSPVYKSEVFIRNIFEHAEAKRTVFLFPSGEDDPGRAYERFLLLREISTANPDTPFYIMLDGYDSKHDEPILDELRSIKSSITRLDYYRLLQNLSSMSVEQRRSRPEVAASMAFYYFLDRATLRGVGSETVRSGAGPIEAANIDPATVREVNDRITEYSAGFGGYMEEIIDGQIYQTLKTIELDIVGSVQENEVSGPDTIRRINMLQRRVARIATEDAYVSFVTSHNRGVLRETFSEIDELCGSNTRSIYEEATSRFDRLSPVEAAGSFESTLAAVKKVLEHTRSIVEVEQKAAVLSDVFDALPEGSAGVIEVAPALVYDLIENCLQSAEYNLVLFSGLERTATETAAENTPIMELNPPDPSTHRKALFASPPTRDHMDELVVPGGVEIPWESDRRLRDLVEEYLVIIKTRIIHENRSVNPGEFITQYEPVPGLGGLVAMRYLDTGARPATTVVYVPGDSLADQLDFIRASVIDGNEAVGRLPTEILDKWRITASTSLDI